MFSVRVDGCLGAGVCSVRCRIGEVNLIELQSVPLDRLPQHLLTYPTNPHNTTGVRRGQGRPCGAEAGGLQVFGGGGQGS